MPGAVCLPSSSPDVDRRPRWAFHISGRASNVTNQCSPYQYIALQILEKLIQTRWKALPVDQQQGEHTCLHEAYDTASNDDRMSLHRYPKLHRPGYRGCCFG